VLKISNTTSSASNGAASLAIVSVLAPKAVILQFLHQKELSNPTMISDWRKNGKDEVLFKGANVLLLDVLVAHGAVRFMVYRPLLHCTHDRTCI
jgi:hypothetical protein